MQDRAAKRLLARLWHASQLSLLIALLLVSSSCTREPRSLVVLAHPDDELTMVDYLRVEGSAGRLMFLTRGENSRFPNGRAAEAEAARRFYGSRSVELLPAPRLHLVIDPTFAWKHWDVRAKIAAVASAIDRYRPDEVVTWMPNIFAVQDEHELAGAIAIAASLRAKHPPKRLLFTYEAGKVGYYRQRPEMFDPKKVGMRIERFVASYSLKKLTALYPSMPVATWVKRDIEAYRQGTRLAVFRTPISRVPLSPPSAQDMLPAGNYRVIPDFGRWLRRVGLAPLGRIIALAPPLPMKTPAVTSELRLDFAPHEPRSMTVNGILYILLPRDISEYMLFGTGKGRPASAAPRDGVPPGRTHNGR